MQITAGRNENDADLAKYGDTSGDASEVAPKFATDLVVHLRQRVLVC